VSCAWTASSLPATADFVTKASRSAHAGSARVHAVPPPAPPARPRASPPGSPPPPPPVRRRPRVRPALRATLQGISKGPDAMRLALPQADPRTASLPFTEIGATCQHRRNAETLARRKWSPTVAAGYRQPDPCVPGAVRDYNLRCIGTNADEFDHISEAFEHSFTLGSARGLQASVLPLSREPVGGRSAREEFVVSFGSGKRVPLQI
jgi:hypothetical protein